MFLMIFMIFLTKLFPFLEQPECSALLDALEQSSSNPEVAIILAKSMIRLFQHSPEKTVASFKKLDAVSRVLKVACIQAQKCRTSGNVEVVAKNYQVDPVCSETSQRSETSVTSHRWHKCVEASVELFTMHLSRADDAKSLVLNSSACIDCLFELFWVEDLRNFMLGFILDLMKVLFCILYFHCVLLNLGIAESLISRVICLLLFLINVDYYKF